jgi:hypothetical protein
MGTKRGESQSRITIIVERTDAVDRAGKKALHN